MNKKIFIVVTIFLLFLLVILVYFLNSRKSQTPVNFNTENSIPSITPIVDIENLKSLTPTLPEIIPTEIFPGTGFGEDGLPFPTDEPTPSANLNIFFSRLNPLNIYAATTDNNFDLSLFGELLKLLFSSFNNSVPTPTPIVSTGPNPQITFNPGSYGSPPPKPYYTPAIASQCYRPQNFIRTYANGVPNRGDCYSQTKMNVEGVLESVDLLGTNVSVHRKAAPYFEAVNEALSQFKRSGKSYNFPSRGNYIFSSVGTYNFRCNVNASTGSNLCGPGCVLSPHSFGIAVDINPLTNGNGSRTYDMPPEVVQAFEANGFRWGGRYPLFQATVDAMHFEYLDEVCP